MMSNQVRNVVTNEQPSSNVVAIQDKNVIIFTRNAFKFWVHTPAFIVVIIILDLQEKKEALSYERVDDRNYGIQAHAGFAKAE